MFRDVVKSFLRIAAEKFLKPPYTTSLVANIFPSFGLTNEAGRIKRSRKCERAKHAYFPILFSIIKTLTVPPKKTSRSSRRATKTSRRASPKKKAVSRRATKTSRASRRASPKKASRRRSSSGQRKITIAKDILKPYGYHDVKSLTVLQRHRALKLALADGVEPLALFRRLNVLYVFNKNTNPAVAAKFKADANYVKGTKEYKQRG